MKLFITLCLFLFCFTFQLSALPAQVILIRHAEKNKHGNLSERGLERAGALAPFFTLMPALLKFGCPVAIFAARPSPREKNMRCIQTVGPTAESLALPIHSGYANSEIRELAQFILHNCDYDGKNVLICWHHDAIQELAIALGAIPPGPFPHIYDQVWVITYTSAITLTVYHQQLLFGDMPD